MKKIDYKIEQVKFLREILISETILLMIKVDIRMVH
jgi:hypothetical protein